MPIQKETTISQRVKEAIRLSGYKSPRAFSLGVGIGISTINAILAGESEPGYGTLCKILSAVPVMSPAWLLLGEGEMLRSADCTSHVTNVDITRQGSGSNYLRAEGEGSSVSQGADSQLITQLMQQISKLQDEMTALRQQNTLLTNKLLGL